jgi:hypothetical protein
MDSHDHPLPEDFDVPDGRERLGRAHQLRVDIAIALSLAPLWLRRALADRNAVKARGARIEIVERIAAAIERRFVVTWRGTRDNHENARPIEDGGPLFGGPDFRDPLELNVLAGSEAVDAALVREEHIANTESREVP